MRVEVPRVVRSGRRRSSRSSEPIANSSMLVLPRMTTPASRSRRTTVASYGGTPALEDPASRTVVGMPSVARTSLSASGTPASGPSCSPAPRRASTARAAAQRAVAVDVQEGVHVLVDGRDPVQVGLGDLDGAELAGGDRRGGLGGGERGSGRSCGAVTPPRRGSAAPGTGRPRRRARRTAPPPGSAPGAPRPARMTLVSGSACEVGGTSAVSRSPTRAIADDDLVELAGEVVELVVVSASRASRARWATSSRVIWRHAAGSPRVCGPPGPTARPS